MRILFAGTPETAVPSLKLLHDEGFDIAGVLTRAPAAQGRKRVLTPSPVHRVATELDLPVLTPRTLKDSTAQDQIAQLAPEAVAVVAYGLIIPPALLTVPRYGWLNLHFSLLPRWRGAAPVNYAIAAGDTTTGTSVFQIEQGLDTGPVFASEATRIGAEETAGELLARLAQSGARQLSDTLHAIAAGNAHAQPQTGEVTLAPQFDSSWARVNWEWPAQRIADRVRAANPAPGAWTTLNGQRFKIESVHVVVPEAPTAPLNLAPGEIGPGGVIGCGEGTVQLRRVAPPGKAHMDASAWLNGARLAEHTRFDAEVKEGHHE
ncbi:methionyl-tRNA formyltransferase [Actinotignum sanguinis]|uniref:methionyl-tRNA formyltransferase n=1 Tax=Actinotignum sanguinis TaxID=1445614 RepID=UPI000F7F0021|nr:methionyl-tRNA formyltransferase [Actinotignum sanguinis]MDY5147390.1 methionyl-tRNA formyltransferase [Actinotignum sanguinis]RTE51519.1 methionyl-tRNA formyltransferase [Actinotignum sanguinis]